MGSPFPGMDPFLEGEMWMEFHGRLANEISAQLMPQLGTRYAALLNKHYWLDTGALEIVFGSRDRSLYPDVHVVETTKLKEAVAEYAFADAGTQILELVSPIPQQIPAMSVEIRDVAERRLVTVIEILSPVNKRGKGWEDYNEKRLQLLESRTHLVEMDLLRAGRRINLVGELPDTPYFAYLSRVQRRPRTQVWAIRLRDKLPVLPIPLLPPDLDVTLDLQSAVDACFKLMGYERLLDYTQPLPQPALNENDAQWAQTRLRAAGYVE